MRQADIFLESEGDQWHARNRDKPRLPDPVIEAMKKLKLAPKNVLELGCGDGWRLAEIQKVWNGIGAIGYDASAEAIKNKKWAWIYQADILDVLYHIRSGLCDLIIFGFCLYLVDREDLMMIAAHTDRVLKDGGYIIVHDFLDGPYRVAYHHKEGLWSYKMDYSKLWLAHPGYKLIHNESTGDDDDRIGVAVLQKDFANAFPEREI